MSDNADGEFKIVSSVDFSFHICSCMYFWYSHVIEGNSEYPLNAPSRGYIGSFFPAALHTGLSPSLLSPEVILFLPPSFQSSVYHYPHFPLKPSIFLPPPSLQPASAGGSISSMNSPFLDRKVPRESATTRFLHAAAPHPKATSSSSPAGGPPRRD